ncbi:MAG TPA: Holliday junction branch migration protein RuvA [Desulfatirhabdiaceae bacterium]|nr:Holliday junction branch migration protein RuvA [Desulfatirhabdiaceae bacterium]
MIGYIEGKLLEKQDDRILILANQIGYEVLVPGIVMENLNSKTIGDPLSLYIYFQQTERQPKPVLIGFTSRMEKDFYQYFISVEDIGPIKGVKALTLPVSEIAKAIEQNNIDKLTQLKGIGNRTAQKIIATLKGKVEKFVLEGVSIQPQKAMTDDLEKPVLSVLIDQLGHKPVDARRMVMDAFKRNASISSPEELLEEIFQGKPES